MLSWSAISSRSAVALQPSGVTVGPVGYELGAAEPVGDDESDGGWVAPPVGVAVTDAQPATPNSATTASERVAVSLTERSMIPTVCRDTADLRGVGRCRGGARFLVLPPCSAQGELPRDESGPSAALVPV